MPEDLPRARHDVLMITYNRAEYTRKSLPRLLDSCDEHMRVWVWQNGPHAATREVVESLRDHPRFHHYEYSEENRKLRPPTNWFWSRSDGAYLSKVDDDCLLEDGWGASLRALHDANPELGVVGCWRFPDEDYRPDLAERKIATLTGGRMMRNPWVQGSGYVMKRTCQQAGGALREGESFPGYCLRTALYGWRHGWAYPFLREEHMDDPRSEHCLIRTDAQFMEQRPLSAINDNVTSLAQWTERVKYMAVLVQQADPDPKHHTGWRKRLQHVRLRLSRILGRPEPWRRARPDSP